MVTLNIATLIVILYPIISHWVADFVLQTSYEGNNKSKSFSALLSHTFTYATVMTLFMEVLFFTGLIGVHSYWALITFWVLMFGTHTIIDYYTSKWTSRLYADNKIRRFFKVIGFDQVLHYITIYISLMLIFF